MTSSRSSLRTSSTRSARCRRRRSQRPGVGERRPPTSRRSRPGRAPRGSPGTAGSTCPPPSTWLAHAEGVAVGVVAVRAPASPRHRWACSVGRRSSARRRRGAGAGGGARRAVAAPARPARTARHAVDHRVVVEVAGGDEHEVGRPVVRASKNAAISSRSMASMRLERAEHLAARAGGRGTAPRAASVCTRSSGSSSAMRSSSRMTWRSASTSSAPERRRRSTTSPRSSRPEGQLPRRQPGVERGVLAGGEGVHLAADGVDRLGDLAGRAVARCP